MERENGHHKTIERQSAHLDHKRARSTSAREEY